MSSCRKDEEMQEVTDDPTPKTEESKNKDEDHPVDTSKKTFDALEETPEATVSPVEAKNYVGKYAAVNGFVADVFKNQKVAYLNFIEKFPRNPFSAVIFESKFNEFGDLNNYRNKFVEVKGRISLYRGRPQIILNSTDQIRVIK
jgi:hypothetical protein